jgi:hypothetical protein
MPIGSDRLRITVPGCDPEVLPLRSQRHVPNSIATLRIRHPGARTATLSMLRANAAALGQAD